MSVQFVDASTEALGTNANVQHGIGTDDWSFSAWVRLDAVVEGNMAILGNNSYDPAIYARMDGGIWGFYNNSYKHFSTTLSVDTWYHLAIRCVSDVHYGYVNGVQDATTRSQGYDFLTNSYMGVGCENGTNETGSNMDGHIEDVALWDWAIPVAWIQSMANSRLRAAFFPYGRVVYWPLDVPGDGGWDAAVVNGDYGLRALSGGVPLQLGTAPDWKKESPGLHWPSRVWTANTAAGAPPAGGQPTMRRWGGVPGMALTGRVGW